jgi:lysophospholipase L1-like esterase
MAVSRGSSEPQENSEPTIITISVREATPLFLSVEYLAAGLVPLVSRSDNPPQAAGLNGRRKLLSKFVKIGLLSLLVVSNSVFAAEYDGSKWKAEFDKFAADEKESPVEPGGVVFVGSSSIRMWDLKKSFPDKGYLNRGFGGSVIADSTHNLTELVAKHKPRLVVFYAGDNDIASGMSPDRVAEDFRTFTKKFEAELPDTKLVYISIKPSIARWKLADKMREANKLIAAECAKHPHFAFVDVWPVMLDKDGQPRKDIFLGDGLHMNETGYKLWVELVNPLLAQ